MKTKEIIKRYVLFVISLFFIGFGIALTKHAQLGVTPYSTVANIVSIKFTNLSFGTWLIISNYFLLLLQIIILGKNFKKIQLLQIPLSLIYGYFTDFGVWIAQMIPADEYVVRVALVIIGTFVLGFGVTLSVVADVILNSAEAFVAALAFVTKKDFGSVKVVFDISWVALSMVLSLVFFGGRLVGTREGTIISAVLSGVAVKIFRPLVDKPLNKLLSK